MFEIGSTLRDARVRQKLELSQVEATTRIRAKYLAALEDERFELLPHPAYARTFLRTYAVHLGLDPRLLLEEYDSRFRPPEDEVSLAPRRTVAPARRFRRRLLLLPAAAILGVIVWQAVESGGGNQRAEFRPPPARSRTSGQQTPASTAAKTKPRPRTVKLRLVAARGRSWLQARLGSARGKVVYERTLDAGQAVRFGGDRLWIRLGAPWNLDATLNGNRLELPGAVADVVITPTGLRTVSRRLL